ncbi:hypothetical protein GRI39_01930 [Altererythrobacter indicus]|uniref:Uncharacterized protein n=1 Tax=Altericroceibacterium indicum TaxID=374177 RepID=A0A845A7L0_9SPHN|nr:hypothetical protein [Altericroceibacterium indicum]MXP24805.1 hypothetical protein [Altericroceibacterium indicum]
MAEVVENGSQSVSAVMNGEGQLVVYQGESETNALLYAAEAKRLAGLASAFSDEAATARDNAEAASADYNANIYPDPTLEYRSEGDQITWSSSYLEVVTDQGALRYQTPASLSAISISPIDRFSVANFPSGKFSHSIMIASKPATAVGAIRWRWIGYDAEGAIVTGWTTDGNDDTSMSRPRYSRYIPEAEITEPTVVVVAEDVPWPEGVVEIRPELRIETDAQMTFSHMALRNGPNPYYKAPAVSPRAVAANSVDVQSALARLDEYDALGINAELIDLLYSNIAFDLPTALAWAYETQVYKLNGEWKVRGEDALARSVVDPSVWSGQGIHVDIVDGNDARSGYAEEGDFSNAKRKISEAFKAGNLTGSGFRVYVKSGQTLTRAFGFLHDTAANQPTQDFAIIGLGESRPVIGTHDDLSWPATTDATYTNCYKVARSSVARVINLTDADSDGVFPDLTKYADADALDTAGAVDGFAQVGSDLYARRADGAPVTNANTRVFLAVKNFESSIDNSGATVNGYLEDLELQGGLPGTLHFNAGGVANLATSRTKLGYPAMIGSEKSTRRIRNLAGLNISIDDEHVGSLQDAENDHVDPPATHQMYTLAIRPKTRKIGSAGSTSNNAFTLHDKTISAIVVGPDFGPVINGSTLRNVGNTKCIVFGGRIEIDANGEAGGAAVRAGRDEAGEICEIYLVGVTVVADASHYWMRADDGGRIYHMDCIFEGASSNYTTGDGVIDQFTQ